MKAYKDAIDLYEKEYWNWMQNNQDEYEEIKERFKYGCILYIDPNK